MQPGTRCDGGVNGSDAASTERGGDSLLSGGFIEEPDIATVIRVNANKIVQRYVAEIIHAKNHARTQLSLYARIHLYRVRRTVVGRQGSERDCRTAGNQVGNVRGVRGAGAHSLRGLLVSCLEGCDALRRGHPVAGAGTRSKRGTDQRAANNTCCRGATAEKFQIWRAASHGERNSRARAACACRGIGEERARREAFGTIELGIVPDGVLIENADAGADYGLCVIARIPRNSKLRSEVVVRLVNPVGQARHHGVELGRRSTCEAGEVAICASRIADVTQTVGDIQIRLDLPAIADVKTDAIVWRSAAARRIEGGDFRVAFLPVAQRHIVHRIVKRAGGSLHCWSTGTCEQAAGRSGDLVRAANREDVGSDGAERE